MSERLSRERIEEIRVCANMRKCPLGPPCPVPAEHCDAPTMLQDALSHIAALEAENERLRDVAWLLTKALNDCMEIFVVFDTDTERVIAIEHTVNAALAALDGEVGE